MQTSQQNADRSRSKGGTQMPGMIFEAFLGWTGLDGILSGIVSPAFSQKNGSRFSVLFPANFLLNGQRFFWFHLEWKIHFEYLLYLQNNYLSKSNTYWCKKNYFEIYVTNKRIVSSCRQLLHNFEMVYQSFRFSPVNHDFSDYFSRQCIVNKTKNLQILNSQHS